MTMNEPTKNVVHELTVDEVNAIHTGASGVLKMCMENFGANWKNVIVEMYRRVVADSFGDMPEESLKLHHKQMKKAIDELITTVKKIRENTQENLKEMNPEIEQLNLNDSVTE